MNETFRGAPTEDGVYVVLRYGSNDIVTRRLGVLYFSNGDTVCPCGILAHRRHEPLVVPDLKELPKVESVSCVIRNRVSGDVCHAIRFSMGFVYSQGGATKSITCFTDAWKELTRAECEAAGYAYPKECEEPQ